MVADHPAPPALHRRLERFGVRWARFATFPGEHAHTYVGLCSSDGSCRIVVVTPEIACAMRVRVGARLHAYAVDCKWVRR